MSEKYKDHWESGTYMCHTCKNPLFPSDAKFKSGTAWPSFREALPNAVTTKQDYSHNMVRTELLCKKCAEHLGHVFDDGKICGDTDPHAGMRFCILSDALAFQTKQAQAKTKKEGTQ